MYDLTIIIPAYNARKKIERCLRSVQRQTIMNFECIVIDDASSDGTHHIVEEFCFVDSRFRLIRLNENRGVAYARNIGLKNAVGKYIGWVDADDFVTEDHFQLLLESAHKNNSDLVLCNVAVVQGSSIAFSYNACGSVKNKLSNSVGMLDAFRYAICEDDNCKSWMFNKLIKGVIYQDLTFDEKLRCLEDFDLMIKIIRKLKVVSLVEKTTYMYELTENSLTRSSNLEKMFEWLAVVKKRHKEVFWDKIAVQFVLKSFISLGTYIIFLCKQASREDIVFDKKNRFLVKGFMRDIVFSRGIGFFDKIKYIVISTNLLKIYFWYYDHFLNKGAK